MRLRPLQVDIVSPDELDGRTRAAWLELLVETPEFATPFLHPDYTAIIGRLRRDTAIAVYRRGQRVIGIFPHQRRPLGFARAVGAPFSDGHGIITAESGQLDSTAALSLARLGAFRFTNLIDPHGCFADARREMKETFMTWIEDRPGQTIFDLRQTHSNHAKKMRRVYRQVEEDFGSWRLELDCRKPDVFRRLLDMKSDQFRRTGLHDVLASPFAAGLMERLWNERALGVRGQLSVLWFADRPAAMEYNLVSGEYMSGWIISFETEFHRYSPGLILAEELIAKLPEIGIRIYDKGVSYGRYKKYTSNVCGQRCEGVAFGTGANAAMRAVTSQAYNRLETGTGEKFGQLAARVRRRFDHIMEAELDPGRRLLGLSHALTAQRPD